MVFEGMTLQGQHVRLEPLQASHLSGLAIAIQDGQLHQLMVTSVPHPDELQAFFSHAQAEQQAGRSLVFVSIDQHSNQVIGSSRFMHTDWNHQRTEIGFTFIAKSKQRTAINTEAKYLMLQHAFEKLGFNRVAFVTDYLNQASRNAILRLGAKQEGILRNHMVMPDGRIRDSVTFSITANEWPGIKIFLLEKLKQ
jgi:RimJ/RimL family protein N-acetyltransferase